MGSWWGSTQLAYKYTIILVTLIVATFIAGATKLYIKRRRVAKAQKQLDLEAAEKTKNGPVTRRQLGEGDLFGVRAIESGYFGGVSQSRPSSVVNSPQTGPTSIDLESPSLISINSASKSASKSTSAALLNLSKSKITASSLTVNEQPRPAMPAKKLRPSQAELSGRLNHAAVDVDMNAEMPPSPIAYKTPDLPIPPKHPGRTLSMHSRSLNHTPESSQEDLSLDHTPPKMPAASLKHLSNSDSIEVEVGSPTVSLFPPTKPKKAVQRQSRGAFTGNYEKDESYIKARQRDTLGVATEDRFKKVMTVELSHLSGISQWGEKVLADLAAQKSPPLGPKVHPLSQFIQPEQIEQLELDDDVPEQSKPIEKSKEAEEPIKSAPEPTHTINSPSESSSVYHMAQEEIENVPSKGQHTRSSSRDSSKSIKRAQDSVKHARKLSREELPQQKRRSLDRDQIRYDPQPAARTRAGSVIGRTVDFDRPRASPFVQPAVALAIVTSNPTPMSAPYNQQYSATPPSHNYNSSVSSYEESDHGTSPSHSAKSSASSFSIPVSRFSTAPKEPTISMTPATTISYSPAIPRSSSTTDNYNHYYQTPVMAQRASMAGELYNVSNGDGRLEQTSGSKKTTNLTIVPHIPSVYGGVETIVEVATPIAALSPSSEPYPKMA